MLTVMTQNAANYDDHPAWMERMPALAQLLTANKVDLLCLTEVRWSPNNAFNSYAATFWQNANMAAPTAVAPNMADHLVNYLNGGDANGPWSSFVQPIDQYGSGQWEGMAIISSLPITNTGWFKMPQGTDQNTRGTQYATVTTAGGTAVFVLNTHFTLDTNASLPDAQTIVNEIGQIGAMTYQFIAGDFNTTPDSQALQYLVAQGFTDSWAQANPGADGYTFPSQSPQKRIDFILTSSELAAAQQSSTIVPTANGYDGQTVGGTVFRSDHLGIVATFDIA